jgi:twitching motility two-component system response regulator PilG
MSQIATQAERNSLVMEAIAAARSGQKDLARQLLLEVTHGDPNHEQGFLWLAALAESEAASIAHLERVLSINPKNTQALNALADHRLQVTNKTAHDQMRSNPAPALAAPLAAQLKSLPAAPPGTLTQGFGTFLIGKRTVKTTAASLAPAPEVPSRFLWRCQLCDGENLEGIGKCGRCGALQDVHDLWAMAENRGVDEALVLKGAEQWMGRLIGGPNFEAHINVARAFLNVNRSAEAMLHLERACAMRPADLKLRQTLETLRSRKLVLAVDDSETVRRLISVSLERKGYRVVTAEDGLQALARLADHLPDIVLLDIAMPKMDGYEVCKIIKGNMLLKPVPVLMLSGKDGIFDKIKGRMAGATDYMSKPFDVAMLAAAMDKHLHGGIESTGEAAQL